MQAKKNNIIKSSIQLVFVIDNDPINQCISTDAITSAKKRTYIHVYMKAQPFLSRKYYPLVQQSNSHI